MNLMRYLLEANLYLAAFYLFYALLLRGETYYQLNRAYLLLSSALAFVLPLLQLGILRPRPMVNIDVEMGGMLGSAMPAAQQNPPWAWSTYALLAYALVTLGMLAHLAIKIHSLIALSKQGLTRRHNGFTIIEIPNPNAAFSFFGYLYINPQLATSATILNHEQVHIRQKHSWDIIYLELLKAANWFNPFVYLLQKSMKELHEFIADRHAAHLEGDTGTYTDFLIGNAYGLPPKPLSNSFFNKNQLKRRIIMLYQKKSGSTARFKYLAVLPLLGSMLCMSTLAFTKNYGWVDLVPQLPLTPGLPNTAYAAPHTNTQPASKQAMAATGTTTGISSGPAKSIQGSAAPQPAAPQAQPSASNPASTAQQADTVIDKPDVPPSFPGGEAAFIKFLRDNIRYPKEAHDKNISGRVFVQLVIEPDGSLSQMQLKRDPGAGISQEALRVLNLSPKWSPGLKNGKAVSVSYIIPINFSLTSAETANAQPTGQGPQTATPATNDKSIFSSVEINPSFPGGEAAFRQFLVNNVKYPKAAKDANVTGRVFVQFIVEPDGSLSNMKALRDPGSGLGNEALRVLGLSPNWTPGVQNGRPVRVQYTVPINFSLTGDTKPGATIKP